MKEKLLKIIEKLGLASKFKENNLTEDDWQKFEEAFEAEYGTSIADAMDAQERLQASQQERQRIVAALSEGNNGDDKDEQTTSSSINIEEEVKALKEASRKKDAVIAEKERQLENMSKTAKEDRAQEVVKVSASLNGPGTNGRYFLGIEHPRFSMSKRWNQIAANPAYAALNPPSKSDEKEFHKEIIDYSESLAQRFAYLKANNLLTKVASGEFEYDMDDVNKTLGDQYVVRRQDQLIARILKYRTVTDIFPVRYGIQDRDVLFNAFLSEVSQAYQEGGVFKGDMEIQPEFGHVDDAMFKVVFGSLKTIERNYLGYTNKEGSDPIKWTMFEYTLLLSYEKMAQEQNKRRIVGIYVHPEKGVPGSYRTASTGFIYTLLRYIHENTLLPHEDESYADYSATTFLDAVQEFVADVRTTQDEDQNLDGMVLLLNANHRTWFLKNIRAQYGKDADFKDIKGRDIVPDDGTPIVWVPNMGQFKLMCLEVLGNLQCIENIPGEMLNVQIQKDMELVKGWSTWKEGFGAEYVGKHFDSLDALKENNYSFQQVFCNKPAVKVGADLATLPSSGFWLVTPDNTEATAVTDISGAKKGIAYVIECGGTTNASTIAKSGKFEAITKAYSPTKVGDYIMVILNSEGKFLELERREGGVRTINKELQPNIPGAR